MNKIILSRDNVTLKVTPEQLVIKADEVLKDVNSIKQSMKTIEEKIAATKSYWLGEAGELHRKTHADYKESIDEMMQRLSEHPKDLKSIANNYRVAESQVTEMANALSDHVII